jgi:DNA-binding transcriptional MerR regulator
MARQRSLRKVRTAGRAATHRGDHRRYDATALDRLQFIRGAKRLGLRLADIRELLDIRDHGNCPCDEAVELLQRRLAELDTEIGRLQRLRGDLARMIDQIPSANCPDPTPGTWRPTRR